MSEIDWIVSCFTILFIVVYGLWKSKSSNNIDSFLVANRQMKWHNVGLSVMATQASAITYLSLPAQAYTNGMGFIQSYFGLPLAMIVICITFIPIYKKLNVYTAYEFLEARFDYKTRAITSALFLIQRGISTGITIYAPAIILSTLLGINVFYTTLFSGLLVVCYTIFGGAKTVSYSQTIQMMIALISLVLTVFLIAYLLPESIGINKVLHLAGKMDKLNTVDFSFNLDNKYTIWSGLIGGFFLQLSYFGTDQSQVGRYLTAKSVQESRLGLIFNGLIKIPMQFIILLIGVLVFVFYQYTSPPIFFNPVELTKLEQSKHVDAFHEIENEYKQLIALKKDKINQLAVAIDTDSKKREDFIKEELNALDSKIKTNKTALVSLMKSNDAEAETDDANYVFLNFIVHYFPKGLIGLIIAIIFLAAMSATASGINGLTSVTIIDFYKRVFRPNSSEKHYLLVSRLVTLAWCVFCTVVAFYAGKWGNLIEVINILGSLVYGVILGIFLVAFYLKFIKARAVFIAAIITELIVVLLWKYDITAFLWLNIIGCVVLILIAFILQLMHNLRQTSHKNDHS